jgi:hypothetical protein
VRVGTRRATRARARETVDAVGNREDADVGRTRCARRSFFPLRSFVRSFVRSFAGLGARFGGTDEAIDGWTR